MPTPSERYKKLEPDRQAFEWRAEKCAALTIPYLFPKLGTDSWNEFPTPFASNAANGVNTMASAMSLALFPPTVPFFRFEMDGELENELSQLQAEHEAQGSPDRPLEEVQSTLGKWERAVIKEIERKNYRVGVHEAIRHLLVTGNALIEHLDEGGLRVHQMRSYVVCRHPDGSLAEVVIHELKEKDQLTDDEIAAIQAVDFAWANITKDSKVSIYTHVIYERDQYRIVQQVADTVMADEITGSLEDCPFWPLRFIRTCHENYGRSYVEEYYGDIASLDTTQQSIVEAGALSAKVLFMVDPASGINPKSLSTAPNGAFRSGRAEGVTTLQVGKQADMGVTFQIWERLAAQVNRAFATPEVRNAERVTAEEIRFLQQQLERNLGGAFPLLALDLQLPMARQVTERLSKTNVLPKLPAQVIEPVIVTGVQALGRSIDADKLVRMAAAATAAMGPDQAAALIDWSAWLTRLNTAEGIESQGLIRTPQQIAAAAQAAQQAQMQQEVVKQGIPAAGKLLTKATAEGSANQPVAA